MRIFGIHGNRIQNGQQMTRHHLQDIDFVENNPCPQTIQIKKLRTGQNCRTPAADERRQELPDGNVETLWCCLRHAGCLIHPQVFDFGQQVIEHSTVMDHRPLGHPRRAGGENHISEAVVRQCAALERHPALKVFEPARHCQKTNTVEQQLGVVLRYQPPATALLQHIGPPIRRQGAI
ncbi:hypothetical protein D3C84_641310 [compost metagenome]